MIFANYKRFKNSFVKQAVFIICLIPFNVTSAYCQVYNYAPFNYFDIETNPSVLASENMNNRLQVYHQNAFLASQKFSYSNLKFSKYFESSFIGLGLSVNNTIMNDDINYNHIGIGAGYRNILFNKVYLKLGVTYKLVSTLAPAGSFDYFSFYPTDWHTQRNFNDNINLALSFSSSLDRYYLSLSALNVDLPWANTNPDIKYPSYYVINIGNLMSLFDKINSEISYAGFSKYSEINSKRTYSHYINLKFNYVATRNSSLNYGTRIGYAENDYFHLIPFVTFYQRKFAINASYNFHLNKINLHSKYYNTSQINLILSL